MSESLVIPLDLDLSLFSRWLRLKGVVHKVVEQQGGQVLLLQDERYQLQVGEALSLFISDLSYREALSEEVERIDRDLHKKQHFRVSQAMSLYPRATPSQAPVIFFLIALSVLFAFLTNFGQGGPILRTLLIIDPFQTSLNLHDMSGRWTALLDVLVRGEVWRLVSPDFLHFSGMHITFNLLMLWVLGGQLEIQKGSVSFLALVFFVSIISNIAQLLDTNYLFGGLSGVVYGLVGYCWLWKQYDKSIFFPPVLLKFSLFWLLLGFTPVTEWMGLGKMANAAHLYGLFAGLAWAAITLYVNESNSKRKTPR